MTTFIPLIRAAAAEPWVRWLQASGRPVSQLLEAADCAFLASAGPNRPVPLLNLVKFIVQVARAEGNDIGCRVVTGSSVNDLDMLGTVLLRERTVEEALGALIRVLPRHCTHESFHLEPVPGGLVLTEFWTWNFDDEALHLIQQYVAALIESFCRRSSASGPCFSTVRLVPHPETGLTHLSGCFGGLAAPAAQRRLVVELPAAVARARVDRRNDMPARDPIPAAAWQALRGPGALSTSASVVIDTMLGGGPLTVDRLAAAAGTSVRGLQRQFAEEGTSFSTLLDAARHRRFLLRVAEGGGRADHLARELGFAHQSALTRAVRRWTGKPPRAFISGGRPPGRDHGAGVRHVADISGGPPPRGLRP